MRAERKKLLFNVYKALSLRAPHEFLERVFKVLSKELPIDVVIIWIIGYDYNISYQWIRPELDSKIKEIDKEAKIAFRTQQNRAGLFLQLNPSVKNAIVSEDSVYIADLSKTKDYGANLLSKYGFKSALIIPLVTEGDKKLVLCIMSKKINAFKKEDMDFFNEIKEQLSAVARVWLYENRLRDNNNILKKSLEEKTYELQVLYELYQSIGYTLNYEELLRLMAQHLYRAMKYDVVATLLVLDKMEKLTIYPACRISDKLIEEIQSKIVSAFNRMSGKELRRIQVICKEPIDKEGAEIDSLGSMFQIPVMSSKKFDIIGMILVGAEKEDAFTETQIRLIYTVAHHASESIQKLRNLMEREQKRLETIIGFMQEGVILLDKDKKVVYANPKGKQYIEELSKTGYGETLNKLGYISINQLLAPLPKGQWHILTIAKPEMRVFEVGTRPIEEGPEQGGWIMVLREVTEQRKAFIKYRKALEGAVSALAMAIEKRDPYTAGHQRHVARLAKAIAREMKLPEEQIQSIYIAALLHDIGKISIPAEILSKPTELNEPEYQLVKFHPVVGYEILKDIDFPWPVAEIVRSHHERVDGSGYPDGLKNGEIPIEARLLAVADVVEAISSHRPYRPALGIESALKEIEKNKGKLYDADIVDACIRLFREGKFQLK